MLNDDQAVLKLTNVFHKNVAAYKAGYRYIINQGGTSSSKTFSTLQLLVRIAMMKRKQIDVVGLTVPHLKAGVLNDMPHVMAGFGMKFDDYYNTSDKRCTFPSGGVINFIAIDKVGKAHGGRRDILYLNEANHLSYPIAEQLMVRTREKIFIDYNPTAAFWVHNKTLKEQEEKSLLIKSTYKDNQLLEQEIVDMIESKRGDGTNNFWRVYGLGELGISEGLVFDHFEIKEFAKDSFDKYRHGIDWGFSNDPFAYVRMAIENDCLYICDEIYQKKLLNKDSAPMVRAIAGADVVSCDSAEPKSIEEYRTLGVNATAVKKGAGSVDFGIKFIQSFQKVYIHPTCQFFHEECMNYQWKEDKNGEALPTPVDAFNHLIDAARYGLEDDMRFTATEPDVHIEHAPNSWMG
jgi:phage terminase large subunit